jgi:hypothetical protein
VPPILDPISFPHRNEVLRAEHEGLKGVVVLEDAGERGRHERLSEPDHVSDKNAAALVEVVGGYLDRRDLKVEQQVSEIGGNAELAQAGSRFLREVVVNLPRLGGHVD